jgi:hypothetical protein
LKLDVYPAAPHSLHAPRLESSLRPKACLQSAIPKSVEN